MKKDLIEVFVFWVGFLIIYFIPTFIIFLIFKQYTVMESNTFLIIAATSMLRYEIKRKRHSF